MTEAGTERYKAVRASDLYKMAERISAVLNTYRDREVKPEDVDLTMVADFCYALDIAPSIEIRPLPDQEQEQER